MYNAATKPRGPTLTKKGKQDVEEDQTPPSTPSMFFTKPNRPELVG